MSTSPRILTNLTFWQSAVWKSATHCIYNLAADTDPDRLPSWREALTLWRRAGRYDVVLTEGIRTSMIYAALCALTLRRSRQVMAEVFIDNARPDDFLWRLKTRLYSILVRRSLGLITNSSAERETIPARYGISPGRLRYVPLNSTILNPAPSGQDDGFVLSAGRTLRDYSTMVMAARHIAAPVIIIGGAHDLDRLTQPLPGNVTVMQEVSREVYLDHLRRCRVVALPLRPTQRSTGQVVMLEAMAFGKPVVTTESPGTVDYIRHGETGFLIPEKDAAALTHHVNLLLRDHELSRRMGTAAVAEMKERGSADRHAELKLEAIRSLWTS